MNAPIPIILLLSPVLWVIFMYSKYKAIFVVIFCIGGILTRSIGCIINDIIDRDLDRSVKRTKNRPIASGEISIADAVKVAVVLAIPAVFLLFQLPDKAIYVGLLSSLLILIYPKSKSFTNFPQVLLGITYNSGVLIAYYTFNDVFSLSILVIYIASIFWTIGFDSIYAYQDVECDVKKNVGSVAVKLRENGKMFIGFCYIITTCCLVIFGMISHFSISYYVCLAFGAIHLYWQVETIDVKNPENCRKKFDSNIIFGLVILLGIVCGG